MSYSVNASHINYTIQTWFDDKGNRALVAVNDNNEIMKAVVDNYALKSLNGFYSKARLNKNYVYTSRNWRNAYNRFADQSARMGRSVYSLVLN